MWRIFVCDLCEACLWALLNVPSFHRNCTAHPSLANIKLQIGRHYHKRKACSSSGPHHRYILTPSVPGRSSFPETSVLLYKSAVAAVLEVRDGPVGACWHRLAGCHSLPCKPHVLFGGVSSQARCRGRSKSRFWGLWGWRWRR